MGINDIMHPLQFEKAEESVSAEYLEQGFSYLAKKHTIMEAEFMVQLLCRVEIQSIQRNGCRRLKNKKRCESMDQNTKCL